MALVLGAVLLAAGAAVPPGLPAPRDLARSVLETHGQELKLLKLLGVARTVGAGWAMPGVWPAPDGDPFSHRRWEAADRSVLFPPRQTFDWGTHFSINFTARQPPCPKNLPDRRGAGCQARPGRVSVGLGPPQKITEGDGKVSSRR